MDPIEQRENIKHKNKFSAFEMHNNEIQISLFFTFWGTFSPTTAAAFE